MAGNKNSGRRPGSTHKPFADALRMEIANRESRGDKRGLRMVAKKLLNQACEGDMSAIREVADRLDGKPVQQNVNDNFHDTGRSMLSKEQRDAVVQAAMQTAIYEAGLTPKDVTEEQKVIMLKSLGGGSDDTH